MNFIKEYNNVLFCGLVLAYGLFLYKFKIKSILHKKRLLAKAMDDFHAAGGGSNVEVEMTEPEAKQFKLELDQSFKSLYPNLKNKKNWILTFITVVFASLLICVLYLKNVPSYEKGNCFTKNMVLSKEPMEEWHTPFLIKKVEFIVLKVGKKNYYVSTTVPSLDDFLISEDYSVEKSNCDIIFQRGQ